MTINKLIGLKAAILAGAALLGSSGAYAATASGNMAVSATVTTTCIVTVGSMAFGNYAYNSASNVDTSATVTIACGTEPATATLAVGGGLNLNVAQRRMQKAASGVFLNYDLYTAATRAAGEKIAVDGALTTGAFASGQYTPVIYGRVPSLQTPAQAGSFTDTVAVTLTYTP